MSNPTGFAESVVSIGGSTRSTYAQMFKLVYLKRWRDWIKTSTKLWKRIGQKKGQMGGVEMQTALSMSLPASAGIALSEGRLLPTPRAATYVQPEEKTKWIYSRLRWTGQVETAARIGDVGAFAKPRMEDLAQARKTLNLNLERMGFIGSYDILGVISGAPTGQIYPLRNRDQRTSGVTTPYNWFAFGAFYMRQLQSVAFCQVAANLPAAATGLAAAAAYDCTSTTNERYITATGLNKDAVAPKITVNSALPTTANPLAATAIGTLGDLVIPYNSRQTYTGEMPNDATQISLGGMFAFNGLGNICTGTTKYGYLHGVSKTTYPMAGGLESTNLESGRTFREMEMSMVIDRIKAEGPGDPPNVAILNEATRREVVKENINLRRFGTVIGNGGFNPADGQAGEGSLMFTAGDTPMPYEENWYCPPGIVFLVNDNSIGWYEESPLDTPDDQPVRWVQDYDAHEMVLRMGGNIICETPASNGTYDDITYLTTALT